MHFAASFIHDDLEAVAIAVDADGDGIVTTDEILGKQLSHADKKRLQKLDELHRQSPSKQHLDGTSGSPRMAAWTNDEMLRRARDEEDASAVMEKHKQMMGTRYIECFRTTKPEMQAALGIGPGSTIKDFEENNICVRMRAFPFGTTG